MNINIILPYSVYLAIAEIETLSNELNSRGLANMRFGTPRRISTSGADAPIDVTPYAGDEYHAVDLWYPMLGYAKAIVETGENAPYGRAHRIVGLRLRVRPRSGRNADISLNAAEINILRAAALNRLSGHIDGDIEETAEGIASRFRQKKEEPAVDHFPELEV